MPKVKMAWEKRSEEKAKQAEEAKQREEMTARLQAARDRMVAQQYGLRGQVANFQQAPGRPPPLPGHGVVRPPTSGGTIRLENVSQGKHQSGPHLSRTRFSTDTHIGTVSEWKGSFGWIIPTKPIEHADMHKTRGRVYCSKQDVSGYLVEGQLVKFRVYSDSSGIGAEMCRPVDSPDASPPSAAASVDDATGLQQPREGVPTALVDDPISLEEWMAQQGMEDQPLSGTHVGAISMDAAMEELARVAEGVQSQEVPPPANDQVNLEEWMAQHGMV